MSSSRSYLNQALNPYYLDGPVGKLFCLCSLPDDKAAKIFLCVPSFAEELNRCRVMVAMQARRFADNGHGCVLLDYYGTGDSQGDFSEAEWRIWFQDVLFVADWLSRQGYSDIVLWGVRVGALLTAELANEFPARFNTLLMWQPVLDGQSVLTQFLRIRMAMLMDRNEPKETTRQMREVLNSGSSLEVAGYVITPALAQGIESCKLANYKLAGTKIYWFEAVENELDSVSVGSQKVFAEWQDRRGELEVHKFIGPAFWQLHEREIAQDLIDKSTKLFG